MKTFKKLLLITAFAFVITGLANNVATAKDLIDRDKTIVSVSVKDAAGTVIYLCPFKSKIETSTFFDYSLLENGFYTIEIENEHLVEIQSFKVLENKVEFLDESKKTIYKPVFKKEDSKILISKVSLDSNQMKVELYYENELIHTETISSSYPILKRAYQLDITEKGNYYAVMKTNGRVYTEKFKL